MVKLSTRMAAGIAVVVAVVLIVVQSWAHPTPSTATTLPKPPALTATATAPPTLVAAQLGGKPVHVLYMTRSGDTVLVRCYPGYQPTITLRTMGSAAGMSAQKEGVMTCTKAGA